jgi:hypothetical protein
MILAPIALVGLGVAAWLAFGVFGVHTLFIDDEVDEAGPVFASGASADDAEDDAASDDAASDDAAAGDSAADTEEQADDAATATTAADDAVEAPATTAPATTAAPAEHEIVTSASGGFVDRSHPTSGNALVLNDGSEQRFLRFEQFATDNGPDLYVYLSTAGPDAPEGEFDDDFVDLGRLSGNVGDQNYEIPPDVDLDRYSTVVIWCRRFAVAFGAAPLAQL